MYRSTRTRPLIMAIQRTSPMRRALLALTLVPFTSARATDRYYSNLEAVSPGGRYRVEAVSPDNAEGPHRKAFQANFTYRLFDAKDGKLVWARKQPMSEKHPGWPLEWSPLGLFVDDDGRVVIWIEGDALVSVNLQGADTGRTGIHDDFSPAEVEKYVLDTTAGPIWGSTYAHFYFARHNGRAYFCVRCWWGRRVVFDLSSGKKVEDTEALAGELQRRETSFVLDTLRSAASAKEQGRRAMFEAPAVLSILRAAHMAGTMGIKEAVPFLASIEDVPYVGATEVFPSERRECTLCAVAQLSLRRLGAKPKLHPAHRWPFDVDGAKVWLPASPPSEPREKQVGKLDAGRTPREVIELLGAPDLVAPFEWRYEIDAPEPYSIRIRWEVRGVHAIERSMPSLWKSEVLDMSIIY